MDLVETVLTEVHHSVGNPVTMPDHLLVEHIKLSLNSVVNNLEVSNMVITVLPKVSVNKVSAVIKADAAVVTGFPNKVDSVLPLVTILVRLLLHHLVEVDVLPLPAPQYVPHLVLLPSATVAVPHLSHHSVVNVNEGSIFKSKRKTNLMPNFQIFEIPRFVRLKQKYLKREIYHSISDTLLS